MARGDKINANTGMVNDRDSWIENSSKGMLGGRMNYGSWPACAIICRFDANDR